MSFSYIGSILCIKSQPVSFHPIVNERLNQSSSLEIHDCGCNDLAAEMVHGDVFFMFVPWQQECQHESIGNPFQAVIKWVKPSIQNEQASSGAFVGGNLMPPLVELVELPPPGRSNWWGWFKNRLPGCQLLAYHQVPLCFQFEMLDYNIVTILFHGV